MAVRKIQPFIKTIQQSLFPELSSRLNINMNTTPYSSSATLATFKGKIENKEITLEFSSNHRDLDEKSKTDLFLYLYYGYKGTKVGIIDLSDLESCIELIFIALSDLGYKSQEDIELEKEQQRKKEEEKARKEKEELQKRKEDLLKQTQQDEEEPVEELPDTESEDSINESKQLFDKYLAELQKSNQPNSYINAGISYSTSENSYKMINIMMYYISNKMCLVQTEGIKPKIDQTTSWDKAKDYTFKVAEKINGVVSVVAADENGKDIILNPEEDASDDLDTDITL